MRQAQQLYGKRLIPGLPHAGMRMTAQQEQEEERASSVLKLSHCANQQCPASCLLGSGSGRAMQVAVH